MTNHISVMTGTEDILGKKYRSQAWYVPHNKCPLSVDSQMGYKLDCIINSKGVKTARRLQKRGDIFIDARNKIRIEKIRDLGWQDTWYEIPDGVILKIKVEEMGYGFSSTNKFSHVGFYRVRERAPYIEICFKNARLEYLIKGRLDKLSPEEIAKLNLAHPSEIAMLSDRNYDLFLKTKIIFPGVESSQKVVNETILIDGSEIVITKPKNKINLPDIY